MGSKNSSPTSIVPQLLMGYNFKNYENWNMCMKSYLLGEDLWDIVDGTESQPESTQPEYKTWRKKDGKALHAIQISCGEDMLDQIREKYSAKAAWDHLAFVQLPDTVDKKLASHKEASSSSTSQGKEDGYAWCLPLYQAVYNGDWKNAKKFLDLHPDAVTSSLSDLGDTALHIAAVAGHEQLVEELVKLMPEEKDLEKKNLDGITALSVAAVGGVTKMAEAMVSKNTNLVRIRNQYNLIPVVVACFNGHKDMVRYLYSKTPKEELSPETGKDGATLLTGTIISDIYDVALDLLQRYPKLAVAVDSYGDTAVTVLARKPYAFPSGSGYNLWQRWIYSCWCL